MNVTDLAIGDWVRVSTQSSRVDPHDDRVTQVKRDGYVETDNYGGTCKYLFPIQLTREILAANGFDIDDSCYYTYKIGDNEFLEYYLHEHRLRRYWEGVDEWQNHAKVKEMTFMCHCHYVHELQHALRLCGLADLADAFKLKDEQKMSEVEKAVAYAHYVASNSFGNYKEDYDYAYGQYMSATDEERKTLYFWSESTCADGD